MKIGIRLPNQIHSVDPALFPRWAVRAEQAGFSTLATVGPTAYSGVLDTVALPGAAAATRSIELSTNVMLNTVWPATLLAKELAGIDGMSGGRLTLGVGIGGDRPDDFVVDGLPPHGLGKRIDDDLEVYREVWRGDPVGGGANPRGAAGTRQIPLLFGGMAAAATARPGWSPSRTTCSATSRRADATSRIITSPPEPVRRCTGRPDHYCAASIRVLLGKVAAFEHFACGFDAGHGESVGVEQTQLNEHTGLVPIDVLGCASLSA